jgi:hypothetical protein
MASAGTWESTTVLGMRTMDHLMRLDLAEALAEGYNRANTKLLSLALKYIPNEMDSIQICSNQ